MNALASKKKVVAVDQNQYEVGFLYDAPPGLQTNKEPTLQQRLDEQSLDNKERQKMNYKQALEEQKLTQYPFLANAPLEGAYVADAQHTLHPIGIVLRNIKCAKCGLYGHRQDERACPLLGLTTKEQELQALKEDPVTKMKQQSDGKFALKRVDDPIVGGIRADDPNMQMLESDKESSSDSSNSESEDEMHQSFLESLSKSQMKALLKEYKREANKKAKKDAKKSKRKKKAKKSPSEKKKGDKRRDRERDPGAEKRQRI